MFKILCPVTGKIIPNSKIKDETFSQNMMGETIGIYPTSGEFIAPFDGKLILCEGHAFSLEANDGTQILVHIGIDTVKIDSKQKEKIFKYKVKVGQKLKAKDPIATVDLDAIKILNMILPLRLWYYPIH